MSKDKLKTFKAALLKAFKSQQLINQQIADGQMTAELGRKLGYTEKGAEFLGLGIDTFTAMEASTLISDHLGNFANIVPILGPAISSVLKIGTAIVKNRTEHSRKESTKKYEERYFKFITGVIVLSLEEVAHEIARIYEYQISALKDDSEIRKAATYAARKMIKHAITVYKDPTTWKTRQLRDVMLEGLISGEKVYKAKSEVHTDIGPEHKDLSWTRDGMFTKPGLRAESKKGYFFYSSTNSKTEKYGYRSRIMSLVDEHTYQEHKLDDRTQYKKDTDESELYTLHRAASLYRLISEEQINAFLANSDRTITFNKFVQNLYNHDSKVIAVCRSPITIKDFKRRDFSGSDFMRARLEKSRWEKATLKGTCFLLANLSGAKFTNANLLKANLAGTNLEGTILIDDTQLVKARLSYASVNKDTDFTNNNTLSGATTDGVLLEDANTTVAIVSDIKKLKSIVNWLKQRKNEDPSSKSLTELQDNITTFEKEVEVEGVGSTIVEQISDKGNQHNTAIFKKPVTIRGGATGVRQGGNGQGRDAAVSSSSYDVGGP